MYSISYEVQMDDLESGFVISSCDYGHAKNRNATIKICPPIKMTVTSCKSKQAIVDYYEAAFPQEDIEKLPVDFREHYREILDCRYDAWKLVVVRVMAGELHLVYYCLMTGEEVTVALDIAASRLRRLTLELEVPAVNGSSTATYHMELEATKYPGNDDIYASTLVEAEYPHMHQRKIFTISSTDPYRLSIADICDL